MASSVEKLAQLGTELVTNFPATPEDAQLYSLFQLIGPTIAGLLPNDPEALDALLLVGAQWALTLRSDDAHEVVVNPDTNYPEEVPDGDTRQHDAAEPDPA